MDKSNSKQKKNIMGYVYVVLIGLLVIAGAITIAIVSSAPSQTKAQIGDQAVDVSAKPVSYVIPMKNATIQKDYSSTELQYNDTLKQWEIHRAIDFLPSEDLNVYAVMDGTVTNVYNNYLEGTVVEISHANGVMSIYKSLEGETNVAKGDKVTAGMKIGQVANSMAQELNSGAHLHFEMKSNNSKVDPNNYLPLGDK